MEAKKKRLEELDKQNGELSSRIHELEKEIELLRSQNSVNEKRSDNSQVTVTLIFFFCVMIFGFCTVMRKH